MKVTSRMREHIESKMEKLAKFTQGIEAQVVLKIEKYLYIGEITLCGKNLRFYGEGRSEDNFFAAFDLAEAKVAAQLKKRKEKIKNHKIPSKHEVEGMIALGKVSSRREVRRASESEIARIVRDSPSNLKPMSLDDAQIELDSTEKPFLVFRNSETNAVNVIYRRDDGNYGLVGS